MNHDLEATLYQRRVRSTLDRIERDKALGRQPARDDLARAYRDAWALAHHASLAAGRERDTPRDLAGALIAAAPHLT